MPRAKLTLGMVRENPATLRALAEYLEGSSVESERVAGGPPTAVARLIVARRSPAVHA